MCCSVDMHISNELYYGDVSTLVVLVRIFGQNDGTGPSFTSCTQGWIVVHLQILTVASNGTTNRN